MLVQKLHFLQNSEKKSYHTDVNREHNPEKSNLKKEVRKMVAVATTAIVAVAAVMAVAIICRPRHF